MTRFVFISIIGTVEIFIAALDARLAMGYTITIGNLGLEKTGSPILREALLEKNEPTMPYGFTLIKNY